MISEKIVKVGAILVVAYFFLFMLQIVQAFVFPTA